MSLWAISDLHLALNANKPMDIFGDNWFRHEEKIKESWLENIKEEDTVLIAGDISWTMKIEDGLEDLEWINKLPGKKIFVKGNHDYWWSSINKLNKLYENMNFIQNTFYSYEDYAICGTRGWICPGSSNFNTHDEKIYKRELIRLRLSLGAAMKAGYTKIIVMLHYPPINEKFKCEEIIEVLKEYPVEKVIYGHLHGPSLKTCFDGEYEGIEFIMTSCDYLQFKPVKIL
ncbi:hypothetical protein SAMN02745196_02490 [Clostridium collagenovorans DSM 3089]|uniref:Calcineurin-like phosphoesterase domain-containing protein n=1 Tax=Clostridium collagenovorans DSM 3089 TaxID=1121306 RepID=A0A1M5XWZ4_9CLOT|nr:metallophosphoesterase [Clostridium collagenovorans]SHI04252.1 hypothetical protein SAMN02745196_02490 [Clostridium collagenovorans DSM 3089]